MKNGGVQLFLLFVCVLSKMRGMTKIMKILEKALKIAGKDDFQLDNKISKKYIIRNCFKYVLMMIRGRMVGLFYENISRNIFIGKKVKLYEKKDLTIGEKTKIYDYSKIDSLSSDGVIVGSRVVLGEKTIIECTGTLSHIGKGIKIGDNSTFGAECFFGAAGGIEIGNDVIAGQYIRFHSENHKFNDLSQLIRKQGVTHKGIRIGNNCWIGSGAVFLDGVTVGDGCVIAANAVVTKSFQENSIIGGNPAKILYYRGKKD